MACQVSKTELTDAVRRVNSFICVYARKPGRVPSFCDCKYGVGRFHTGEVDWARVGEVTGCPEMRLLTAILEAMTEQELDDLVERALQQALKDTTIKPIKEAISEDPEPDVSEDSDSVRT